MKEIIERIEHEAGVESLVSILANRLSPTDLQSLLLEVYRQRAGKLQPRDVLRSYASNRFVRPSPVPPQRLSMWETVAFSYLPQEFEAVALSPVCPLGTNTVVASIDQNWAVSTARNSEVVSDSTNVLALECAVRRRDQLRSDPKSAEAVHLAASHRLVRAQKYANPNLAPHFSSFALCSAGRDMGNFRFELEAIGIHIRFYVASLNAFFGDQVPISVAFTDFRQVQSNEPVRPAFFTQIQSEFDNVSCALDNERDRGRGYYADFGFMIYAIRDSGERLELIDGGAVDWTQKYLSNAKERLIVSGLGTERLCQTFDPIDAV